MLYNEDVELNEDGEDLEVSDEEVLVDFDDIDVNDDDDDEYVYTDITFPTETVDTITTPTITPTVIPEFESIEDPEYATATSMIEIIIDNYELEYLESLEEDGYTLYVVYEDGTEDEVDASEIVPLDSIDLIDNEANVLVDTTTEYFWSDEQGVHVTHETQESWLAAVEDNFSDLDATHLHHNILMNSYGLLLRSGLNYITQLTRSAIAFYDGLGNNSTNIVAMFGRSSAQIGASNDRHIVLDVNGLTAYDANGNVAPITGIFDGANITNSTISGSKLIDSTITGGKIASSTITNSNIVDGTITGAKIQGSTLTNIPYAQIDELSAKNITSTMIQTATAYINSLNVGSLSAADILADHATVGSLDTTYAQINLANVNNAWISNGAIKNAAIGDAQISGVSANKLTAGTIDASNINVANLRADSLIVNTVNGQPVFGGYTAVNSNANGYSSSNPHTQGWYEISNGQMVLTSDTSVDQNKAYYTTGTQVAVYNQTYVDNLATSLNNRIDGAIETYSGSVVPTLVNSPYTDWYDSTTNPITDNRAEHVGDLYYVVNNSIDQDGYCYRFYYDSTSQQYMWVLIKDSDVTSALGRIDDLESFETSTSSWITTTDTELTQARGSYSSLKGRIEADETSINSKVETSTFNTLSNTVDSNTASITKLTTRVDSVDSNMLLDWNAPSITKVDAEYNRYFSDSGNTSITTSIVEIQNSPESNITYGFQAVNDGTNTAAHVRGLCFYNSTNSIPFTAGGTYTATWWGRCTSGSGYTLIQHPSGTGGTSNTKLSSHALTSEWKRFTETFTIAALNTSNNRLWFFGGFEAGVSGTIQLCGFRLVPGESAENVNNSVTTLTNTVNTVSQTATSNSSVISSLTTTLGTNSDGTTKANDVVHRMTSAESSITQNTNDILLRATKTEAIQLAQPNISPFFESGDIYNATTNPNGYWRANFTSNGYTRLSDGWAHFEFTNTDSSTASKSLRMSASPLVVQGEQYTCLIEFRNVSITGNTNTYLYTQQSNVAQFWGNHSYDGWTIYNSDIAALPNGKGSFYKLMTARGISEHSTTGVNLIDFNQYVASGQTISYDIRYSLYPGEYNGPWKPYSGSQLYASKAELKVANDAIDLRVEKNGVIGAINLSSESATISADKVNIAGAAIFSDYSTTTQMGTAIANAVESIEIGGRNLLLGTATWSKWKNSVGATISGDELSYTENKTGNRLAPAPVVPGKTYTLSFDMYASRDCVYDTSGNAPVLLDYSSTESYTRVTTAWIAHDSFTTSWKRYSYTFTVPSDNTIGWVFVSLRNVNTNAPTYHMRHMKLEKGNKATDWTPAPEDIDEAVDAANDQEQLIYKSAASGTTTMSGTTTWVSDVTGAQATWTIKRPEYSQSYPVLFVATQRKTVGGTVTCTTPVIDATTTVIDGGNIITGSVTANQLNASNINASNSFTIGAFSTDTQNSVLNSNVVVGGRNLLCGTKSPTIGSATTGSTPPPYWYVVSGGNAVGTIETISDSPIQDMKKSFRLTGNTSGNKDFGQSVEALQADWTGSAWVGASFTFSAWVRGIGASCTLLLRCYGNASNMSYTQSVSTTWTYVTKTFTLSGGHTTSYERFQFGISGAGTIEYLAPKLEKGNKATDWTPAPEDTSADISDAVDNVNVGGRNLLRMTSALYPYESANVVGQYLKWRWRSYFGTVVYDDNTANFTRGSSNLDNDTGGMRVSCVEEDGSVVTTSGSSSNSTNYGLIFNPGDTITFSCEAKTSGNRITLGIQCYNGSTFFSNQTGVFEYTPVDTDWHRYSVTVTLQPTFIAITGFGIYCQTSEGVTLSVRYPKLERGNKATDWTPAPEDIDEQFNTQFTAITNDIYGYDEPVLDSNNEVVLDESDNPVVISHPSIFDAIENAISESKEYSDSIETSIQKSLEDYSTNDHTDELFKENVQGIINDLYGYEEEVSDNQGGTVVNTVSPIFVTTDTLETVNTTLSGITSGLEESLEETDNSLESIFNDLYGYTETTDDGQGGTTTVEHDPIFTSTSTLSRELDATTADILNTIGQEYGSTKTDLINLLSYIRGYIDSDTGVPTLKLGREVEYNQNGIESVTATLTNSSLDFNVNSEEAVASIGSDEEGGLLKVTRANIGRVDIGDHSDGHWEWQQRSNGNLALKWIDSPSV